MTPEQKKLFDEVWRKANEQKAPLFSKSFAETAWNKFELYAALEVLLSKEKSFRYHEKILFDALCSWIVAPHQAQERREAILRCVRLALAQFEKPVIAHEPDKRFQWDIVHRMLGIGPQFIQEIYYPIGGIRALSLFTHSSGREAYLRKQYSNTLFNLMMVVGIIHREFDVSRNLEKFYGPSQTKAMTAVAKMAKLQRDKDETLVQSLPIKYLSDKALEIAVRDYRQVAVLAYAAQFVQVTSKVSLLDCFFGRSVRLSRKRRQEVLRQWLGVYQYLADTVFVDLAISNMFPENRFRFDHVEQIPIKSKKFSPWESEIIEGVFKRHKRLK